MARSLPSPTHNPQLSSIPMMNPFFAVLAVLSIFSVVTFLCGKMKKLHGETEETESKQSKQVSKLNSNLGYRAVSMVKMISWRKVQAEEGEGDCDERDHDEAALWRKNILMGERCRPLDFSVKSVHESEGKVFPALYHHH